MNASTMSANIPVIVLRANTIALSPFSVLANCLATTNLLKILVFILLIFIIPNPFDEHGYTSYILHTGLFHIFHIPIHTQCHQHFSEKQRSYSILA